MADVAYVNDGYVISQNPKVAAINSCIEVDLTGQIVSDSIGTRMYSGEPLSFHTFSCTVSCIVRRIGREHGKIFTLELNALCDLP